MIIFKESCQIDHNDNILIFFFKRLMLSKIWVNNYFAHIFLVFEDRKTTVIVTLTLIAMVMVIFEASLFYPNEGFRQKFGTFDHPAPPPS